MFYVQAPSGEVFQTENPERHSGCKILPRKPGESLYRAQYCESLRARVKPGDRVYTLLRSVSRSGMQRTLSVLIVTEGRISDITYSVAIVAGYRQNNRGHIIVGGCGFDAGFDVVYSLGRALWPDGTPEPHGTRNGQPDSDGGYALKNSWL